MKNYVQKGDSIRVKVPASTTWIIGQAVLLGAMLGVVEATNNNTASSTTGEVVTMCITGIVTLPATVSQTVAVGAKLYWDATNSVVTTTSSSNTLIGRHGAEAPVTTASSGAVYLDVILTKGA